MKKVLAMTLTLVMILGLLAGCGGGTAPESKAPESNAPESNAPESNEPVEVNWPNGGTVYFDVPAKAGGGTDMLTRSITTAWAEYVDADFVVTNYETSEVGAQHVKNADPDGFTLTYAACTNMDNYLTGSSEVNPMEDYTCIAKIVSGNPQTIFTNADAPYSNLTELKEYIEANSGDVVIGVALGGTSHLMWLNIIHSLGVDADAVTYVQCGSEADKLTNVAGGSINLGNGSLNNSIAYEADNKIKVIAICSYGEDVGRDDINPELPDNYLTTWEQGFVGGSWTAGGYICGPANMDPALVEAINKSVRGIGEVDSFLSAMEAMSQVIALDNVEDSQADFAAEWEMQKALTTNAGLNIR